MGTKNTPIEIRALRMTEKRAEKLIKGITPTPGPLVEPPEWLTEDQKAAWKYAIENAPSHVLRTIDKAVLAGFIVAEDTHRQAAIAMQRTSLLVKTASGAFAVQNPYLPIVNRQMVLMMRAASELGFSPCSRARIDSGKPADPGISSDWDEIAAG